MITVGTKIKELEAGDIWTVTEIVIKLTNRAGEVSPWIRIVNQDGVEHEQGLRMIKHFLTDSGFEIIP